MNAHSRIIRGGIIRGAKGGKGSSSDQQHTPVEAPNTLQSNAVARVVDLISEGEIFGLVDGLKSVKFDGTPLQNADGSFNYRNVQIDGRVGLPDQDPMLGFSDVETVVGVSAQVTALVPIVRTISNTDATSVRVTIEVPALSIADQTTGDINATSVVVQIEIQPNNGVYYNVMVDTISGKTTSPYQRDYRIALPGEGPWNVRVTRPTPDSNSALLQNQTFWSSYTIIEDFKLIYPDSALIATAVDAQSFGGKVPTRTFEVKGIMVQVPANYDPATRTYATTGVGTSGGAWDGTFKTAWTDNPAWIWYDLVTNDRYGLGQFVGSTDIDKFGLYAIAQYCDELVPDGFGGTEPRFTFNGVIATADDAIKVLTTMASVFRGMVYWGVGGATAVCDMPSDLVKLVTPANVIDGMINYEGAALKVRHSVAFVTWYDPENSYQTDIEIVEDGDAIARFGWRLIEVVAFGCTSRGQAHRFGKWILDSEKNETETATWTASWDHADVAPGEIVAIADPAVAGVRLGGRIAALALDGSDNVTGITIDDAVTLSNGVTYTCSMMLKDGRIADRTLSNAAGSTSALTFTEALPDHPATGAVWVLSSSEVSSRLFRVIARVETDKHLFQITALLHDPTKYARVELDITLEAPRYTALPTGPLAAPTDLTVTESITLAGGSVARNKTTVSWTAAADSRVDHYEVQDKPDGQNWQAAEITFGVSVDIFDLKAGPWGFRVRSVDALGRVSAWLSLESTTLEGLLAPPDDVVGIRANFVAANQSIAWTEIDDPRPTRYAIRKGDSWDAALELGTVAHPPFAVHGNGNYWVAAYIGPDDGRIYSSAPQNVEIAGASLESNVVADRNEREAGWPGIFTGTAGLSGTSIRTGGSTDILTQTDFLNVSDILNLGAQGNGGYEMDSSRYVDNGRVAPCRVTISWKGTAEQVGQDILSNPDVLNMQDFLGSSGSDLVDVYPEISWSATGYVGDVYNLDPVHNPDNDIYAESDIYSVDVSFQPWQRYEPGVYLGRVFRSRLILKTYDPQTIAVGLEFAMRVDVDGRTDTWGLVGGIGASFTGITVPNTGLAIVFAPNGESTAAEFHGGPGTDTLPHVQITNGNGQTYDFTWDNLTTAGVTVFAKQAGVAVSAPKTNLAFQGY